MNRETASQDKQSTDTKETGSREQPPHAPGTLLSNRVPPRNPTRALLAGETKSALNGKWSLCLPPEAGKLSQGRGEPVSQLWTHHSHIYQTPNSVGACAHQATLDGCSPQ